MMEEQIMRKNERQQFVKQVIQLLQSLGAKENEGELYRFIIQTKAGSLHLTPEANTTIGLGTLFTRFDDPTAARQIVDCNKFSGKWNHHYFDGWTVETAIADLNYWLGKIISSPSSQATTVCSLERTSQ
jgi:hypothetical protein